MGQLRRFNLPHLIRHYRVTHVIETGFGKGASSVYALRSGAEEVYSCEIYKPLFDAAPKIDNLHLYNEDSLTFLSHEEIKRTLFIKRAVVFLDAHFPGADFKFEDYQSNKYNEETRLPLLNELRQLKEFADNALIIIDDSRIYLRVMHEATGCKALPPPTEDAENAFLEALEAYSGTHIIKHYPDDQGYVVLWPKSWREFGVNTHILAGDRTAAPVFRTGIPGSTCMSINRRLLDARFSTRWLSGKGLDIGGGDDSIALYQSLFPLIQSITVFDLQQGGAQYLARVPDNEFDFVYSGHCLEHVMDPYVALPHWLRVVKPGGHLVLTIPDEDLYEQGVWPSTFNDDHKHTFTPFKHRSWSPVSVNVLSLLQTLPGNFSIEKIERLNHSHLKGMPRFDQTRTAFAESAIEIIIQKLKS
ncbi:class I SAM-dependent methyltransferase [Citrobacter koseri]|uniref:class I SAM-dependent methyltransferase n=1 Tax=Citrobacter koseri TaxID=545 RepID=UPI001A929585|nr:class I SAM-dependent methyltransferase [Citrobacter koseri]